MNLNIKAAPSEEILLSVRKKRKQYFVFEMSGVSGMHVIYDRDNKKIVIDSYPLIDTLLTLSKAEQWLFSILRNKKEYKTNIANISNIPLTKVEKTKKSRSYQVLKKLELVRRVRNGHYMINPNAMVNPTYYEDMLEVWNSLSK